MPPKPKESKPAETDGADGAGEQQAIMESELVTAVLRSRLGRYQAAGEKLAVENFSLTDELAKQKLTLQDINEFLTNELKARSLAAAQLEERVAQLNARLADVQKEAQANIARAKAEAAAEAAAALGRAAATAAAAGDAAPGDGSTGDLTGQKAQLERTVNELTATLSARQRDFDARMSDMERRHLQDKEKMRKEAAAKISETKMAMAQLADQHLESSTKRTLVENETMVAELAYHTAQSHDLVAANGLLRAEAAELRRQLAIAHKTVQSTAYKNLLLQQTIKSILTCLREEARQNAEITVAAHQQLHCTAASSGDAAAAALRPLAGTDMTSSHLHPQQRISQQAGHGQQDQQPSDPQVASHDFRCDLQPPNSAGAEGGCCPGSQQQGQQHQQECVDNTHNVLQHLECRVVQLMDECAAAKQALAAALQGALPQELQATCTITGTVGSPTAAGAAGAARSTMGAIRHDQAGCCCAHSSKSSPCSPQPCRSHSPVSSTQRAQQHHSSSDSRRSCCCCSSSCQPGPMEAALQDGVAAFVLYCVQELRRGGADSRQHTACTPPGPGPTSTSISSKAGKGKHSAAGVALTAGGGSSRCVSPATGAPAAADVGSSTPDRNAATSRRPGGALTAASAGSDGGPLSNGEVLARLLLEQLHSYCRQNLAVFDGLAVSFAQPGEQQGGAEGDHGHSAEHDSSALVAVPGPSGAAASEQVGLQWPAAPLPSTTRQRSPGALRVDAGSAGTCAAADECRSPQQLPALPSLLNNMGRSLASPQPAAAAVCRGPECKSPSKPGREDLFGAVLSELRPWGSAGSLLVMPSSTGNVQPGALSPGKAACVQKGGAGSPLSSPSKGHSRGAMQHRGQQGSQLPSLQR